MRRARIDRLERAVAKIPPSPHAVRKAYAEFEASGELPENVAIARAVITWADTGVDSTQYGADSQSRGMLLCAYIDAWRRGTDKLMHQLREEAVYAKEPVCKIARIILEQLAADGLDPTQPLFLQGRIPTPEMTCASVALSMVRFPYRSIDEVHHQRLGRVVEEYRRIRKVVEPLEEHAWDAWIERCNEAAHVFETTGELPEDALIRDTLLAEREMYALFDASHGKDDVELREALAACDEPDEDLRAMAIEIVEALAEARARRGVGPADAGSGHDDQR